MTTVINNRHYTTVAMIDCIKEHLADEISVILESDTHKINMAIGYMHPPEEIDYSISDMMAEAAMEVYLKHVIYSIPL